MLKFKFLLWMFTQLLKRQVRKNAECRRHIADKELVFQIRTVEGIGRYFVIQNDSIRSFPGLTEKPSFTMTFKNADKGFQILSAKDSQAAFIRGLGSQDLIITGDFLEVMWFQRLTAFLQPAKTVSPYDRTAF